MSDCGCYSGGREFSSPTPGRYGALPAGETAAAIMTLLGGIASGNVMGATSDPAVRALLADIQNGCKTKAKEGVTEWGRENWHWLVLGGGALAALNFASQVLAIGYARAVLPKSSRVA